MKRKYQSYLKAFITLILSMILLSGTIVFAESESSKAPTLEIDCANVKALDIVEIVLEDTQGFDMLTLWEKSNYDIQGDVDIINVLTVTPNSKDGVISVVLKTDPFEANKTHRLEISNLKNASGQIFQTRSYAFYAIVDENASYIETQPYTFIEAYTYKDIIFYGSAADEVTVIFNQADQLNTTTLKNINNYKSEDLSFYDLLLTEDKDKNCVKVILLADKLKEDTQYHITINNLRLNNGNLCHTFNLSDYISSLSYDELQAENLKKIKSDQKQNVIIKKDVIIR